MVFPSSRYAPMQPYTLTRADGTRVAVLRIPLPGPAGTLGFYRRNGGERLDAIAAHFLADATAFWRLCDANGAIVPDALATHDLVGVPLDAPVRG